MSSIGLLFVAVILLSVIYSYASSIGRTRWARRTALHRNRLLSTESESTPQSVDLDSLDELAAPVRRYLRAVLHDGHPIATGVRLRHEGTFNTKEAEEHWKPFSSQQWVLTRPPGFLWNARIAMAPGLPVFVLDAYINGWGVLRASILGLFSVARMKDRSALARGELMRYFAECVWYPTALLPEQGVTWEALDDRSAYGTLDDGANSVTLLFRFGNDGLVESVRSDARGRTVGGKVVSTPWQGRFSNYREWDGMLVPMNGEVSWLPEQGEHAYWRGEILDVEYEYSDRHLRT